MPPTYPFYLRPNEYVRHRARQVRQSIYSDARVTLETLRDYAGRLPDDPNVDVDGNGDPRVFSWLAEDDDLRLPILGQDPMTFIDYFPDGGIQAYEKLELNTLALDNGRSEEEYEYELGGLFAQEWTFTFAINASTDAVAMALFQDLNDRYIGRTSVPSQPELIDNLQPGDAPPGPMAGDRITLYNYAASPPIPIVRMEMETFRFAKTPEEVAPGVHLFFGELVLTDFLPQGE